MAAITTASPKILSLPQVGSTGILGAGIGFNSQVSTGTISSTNTDTTAILGIADLQLSAFGSANAGGANGVGSRWTPKHLTVTITNTSGQTLTGITLTTSNVDAPEAPGTADYSYGQASDFPSAGLASGDSVTVTYTILGVIKRYVWLTGTWTTAPVAGALALDVDLSGEGSAAEALKGSLAPFASGKLPWSGAPQVSPALGGGGGGWHAVVNVGDANAGPNVGAVGLMLYDTLIAGWNRYRAIPGSLGVVASAYSGESSVAITTSTTTSVKASAGVVGTIINAGSATSGVITIYDNTAASGKTIWAGTLTAGQVLPLGIPCGTGITVVTAAADTITVSYA